MKTAIFILILTVITSSAFCKTITVTSSADSGAGTLRQAIADADSASIDKIVFEDSISSITLIDQIDIEKSLRIIGDSVNSTTLIMNGNGTRKTRHIKIFDSAEILLCNLTLRDNHANCDGGAIINNGTLTLNSCTFLNNKANYTGGAILSYGNGELYVYNCIFDNNYSSGIGGAIRCSNLAHIETCSFTNNFGSNGGALYLNQGSDTLSNLKIIDCKFYKNSASFGGAIYNYGNMTIMNSSFVENSATNSNAVIGSAGYLLISNSIFEDNESGDAGIISNKYYSSVGIIPTTTIINCLLFGNKLTDYDYPQNLAILKNSQYGTLSIINSTIVNNTATPIVGDGTINLYNNILWNNTQNSGDEYDLYISDTTNIKCHNNIIGNTNTLLLNSSNYLDIDPLFNDLNNNDFSLQAGSPAIDAGNTNYLPDSILTDILGGSRISGSFIDIGACEYQKTSTAMQLPKQNKHKIYSFNKQIVVKNNTDKVEVYDIKGNLIDAGCKAVFSVPQSGFYIVKIDADVRKIIVE